MIIVGEHKVWKFGVNGNGGKDCLSAMVREMAKKAEYPKGTFSFHSLRAG